MKKMIASLVMCLLAVCALGADPSASPVFQMRLTSDSAVDNVEEMTLVTDHHDSPVKVKYYVQKKVLLDQTALKSAKVAVDKTSGRPHIEIVFSDDGRKRFADVTRENIGHQLAIVLDGQLYCAPVIRTEIPGGNAVVDGAFSKEEADQLAAKINGALKK